MKDRNVTVEGDFLKGVYRELRTEDDRKRFEEELKKRLARYSGGFIDASIS